MNSKYHITAILPVYNGEKYIEETLSSVLATRRYSKTEIIVVNDGSTDETNIILKKYNNQIEILNQKNQGQARAINNALNLSKSPFCSIVNCDDPLIDPEIFAKSIAEIEKDQNLIVSYPNWEMIDEDGRVLKKIQVPEFSRDELIGNFNCIVGPGAVFKVSTALLVGGWNPKFRYVPDYDFWLRMSNYGNFIKINQTLASWRYHKDSISVKSKTLEMSEERINVMRDFLNNSITKYKFEKKAIANSIYSAAILSAFDAKINGRKLFIKAIKIYPMILKRKKIKEIIFLITYPISRYIVKISKLDINNY
jgi:glycosyltransferase involved in cell wall biosynthesis